MKILHTTDLHFNKEWFEWIEKQEDSYDVFCITGDFLEETKEETLQEQIDWISTWMRKFKKPLFVCSGNHDIEDLDNEDWLNKIPNVYSDGSIKTINGVKFGCVPYVAPDFYDFAECDVLLYHIPVGKTKTSYHNTNNCDWGDKELYRLVKNGLLQPNAILCGHLHRPKDTTDKINQTIIYNPGVTKGSQIPNHHKILI